jgi:mono/diheme cytochrome c family protein
MKTIAKWIGILLGLLVGILVLVVAAVFLITNARINKSYDISLEEIAVPTGAEAITNGEHIATIRACNGCHGPNLGGDTLIEDPMVGGYYPPNLTTGQGGRLSVYSNAQIARAVRHGVGYDDKPLLLMPAHEFSVLSDEDVGAIIAYIRAQPPVDNVLPESKPGPLARVLFLTGDLPLLPVELIDHESPRPPAPEPGVTVEYGEYLAVVCQGCHQADYAGGPIPGAPPDAPPALNLTPGGELAGWTEADFIATIRTGVTPGGRVLDPSMPAGQFTAMTDDELKAIFLFLQSLPSKEQGR